MNGNKYLIQALRAYRTPIYDQYGTKVGEQPLELAQDAADALETAEENLKGPALVVHFTDVTELTGHTSTYSWDRVRKMCEDHAKHMSPTDQWTIRSLVLGKDCLSALWEPPKKG